MKLNENQVRAIIKAGLTEGLQKINRIDKLGYHIQNNVHRLYAVEKGYSGALPSETLFSVAIEDEFFVQIDPGFRKFNHAAAIKYMEAKGLLKAPIHGWVWSVIGALLIAVALGVYGLSICGCH